VDSGEPTYAITYQCTSAGPACPGGQPCPAVPLGDQACGDLPALFNHDPVHVDTGRPPGCTVGLPYGNPFYAYSQQLCTCTAHPAAPQPDAGSGTHLPPPDDAGVQPPDASHAPTWECSL
jgi:hypothetical protein